MIGSQASTKSKILSHLKKLAPFSVVERGINWASQDMVGEFSSINHTISGIVREDESITHSVSLIVISSHEVDATCSCCSKEDLQEQWCPHAVALLWRAAELEFFEPRGGFNERESTFRVNSSSPAEIAQAIREVQTFDAKAGSSDSGITPNSNKPVTPNVTIVLDINSDRLGMKVLFDEQEQEPAIFKGFRPTSTRALDNILLQILEDEGSWDESGRLWFINSSKGIEIVLGLIQEYDNVLEINGLQPISLSHESLEATLQLAWRQTGLDISMNWVIPGPMGRREAPRSKDVFGTGPFWTLVNDRIYRLSPQAARIASIFGSGQSFTLGRAQVGPILEALMELDPAEYSSIQILNGDLQPSVEVKDPLPVAHLERRDVASDHFTSHRSIEISATVEFEYPLPAPNSNTVFLRNKRLESEAIAQLASLGFSTTSENRRYSIQGDAALDFVHESHTSLGENWKLIGLEAVKKGIRFAELKIAVALSGASAKRDLDELENATTPSNLGGSIDWFDCHVSVVQNNANLPLSAVFKNARGDNDRWTRLDSGAYARIPGGSMGHLRTILGMVDSNARVSNTIKTKLSLAQAISLGRITDAGFSISLDRKLAALNAKLSTFSEINKIKPSKGFIGKLRNYQEEGISWLNFLHEFELGGILADEMGLGKTVQTLAFFQTLKEKRNKKRAKRPILIVAPTSVITNWHYEIKKFTPEMSVVMLHGAGRKALFAQVPDADIVLTSYALLRVDRYELERYEFSYIVLDEAQNIKNPQAATTKAAKAIRARQRLALTGTPTENRPMELWSIMDFLMPGYLGTYEFFRANIERPILEGGTAIQAAQMLNSKTRPFILRRLKADVEKELPPKIESVLHVEMTPSQRQIYSQILNEVRPKVFDAIKKKGIQGASVSILAALLRLRQVCNHPNSIEAFEELEGYDSGKFNLLKDLTTEALESGRKILLFSQFRGMLGIIRTWLEEAQVKHLYLDGATRNRQELIDQFSQDESVRLFLISLKAGGSGLNLMAADTVIIYDPWWNPAVESQAVDRAHRIGQSKTVSVYRLVTEDSVEQKIMALKEKKSKLVDALINENGLSTLKLAKADLESLFSPLPELE
jgi:superfamily II DNA or RNA helicase